MKVVLAILAYFVSLAVTTVIAWAVVMILAGPHSGFFPVAVEKLILALGWLAIVFLPFLVSWKVYRRLSNKPVSPET